MVGRPSGTVTFLFTDIEGSTRLWEAHPAEMQAAVARHDELTRETVDHHGGTVFSTGGDGFAVAFGAAREAVAAALDLQRAFAVEMWPHQAALLVRMGIHTGEVEERGGNYFGPHVNRTARLMAAANGGQIVVSDTAAGVLAQIEGIELVDAGECRLRDLSAAQHLFLLRADDWPGDGRPLRTIDVVPGNLPTQLTSFVGRAVEVDQVTDTVLAHRLVTLTGVGGVGKTRLALQSAAELLPKFADGVWLVELAAVHEGLSVGHAVAAALGLTQQPGLSPERSVAEALVGRRMLLVLDNCEHVLDEAASLARTILSRASSVSILATSREALDVPGEQAWPVPALAHHSADAPAVELFIERARSVAPAFDPAAELDMVLDICRRLDGVPLAIELAAARIRSLSARQVHERLTERFNLLRTTDRGAVKRHQALDETVRWSFDLLSRAEREVLCRLSVFSGGFTLDAAEMLTSESGAAALDTRSGVAVPDTLDVLDSLVRKSLVTVDRRGRELRYGLLETIREFAGHELEQTGAISELRDAHAHHFATRAEENLLAWVSPAQAEAFDWFTTELANLRAAYRWSARQGDFDTAALIVASAGFVAFWRLNYEPVSWAEDLLPLIRDGACRKLSSVLAAAANCVWLGRVPQARAYADAAVEVRSDSRYDPDPNAWEFVSQSLAGFFEGRIDRFVDSLAAGAAQPQDRPLQANRCWHLWGLAASERFEEARSLADGVVAAAEETRIPWTLIAGMHGYGRTFASIDPAAALAAYRRGLSLARETSNRWWYAISGSEMCALEVRAGEPVRALESFAEMVALIWEAADTGTLYRVFGWLVTVFEQLNELETAVVVYGSARDRLESTAHDIDVAPSIARARRELAPAQIAALLERGAGMDAGEAVAYVHADIERVRRRLIADRSSR